MPYFVHLKDTEPTDESTRYESRADAYRAIPDRHTVTFKISDSERHSWKMREYQRFKDGVYALPPWIEELFHCWEPSDSPEASYKYPALAMHFAHISIETPGLIAYTPSDEHGYQDRQTKIKVGRYLEEHAREYFTQEQINSFVDQVKGYSSDLQLARTADEIYNVYRNSHRGSLASCMSHPTEDYSTKGIHPTAVYGDSDLAVAYLGSIECPTARCIVWPAKKRYTRVYGDTTIKAVLEKSGYEYVDGQNYGDLEGAKVRAIKVPGRSYYVMPYVDAAVSADLDEDGKYFTLHDHDGGEYDVHNSDYVDGITHENDRHRCEHCNESCDEDEMYCSSCEDDRIGCERCGETYWDSSDDGRFISDSWYCTYCADTHYAHECEGCGDSWDEVRPSSSYCSDCADHYNSCDECSEMFDTRDCDSSGDLCDECHKAKEDEDTDEDETADEDGVPEVALAPSYGAECDIPISNVDRVMISLIDDRFPTVEDVISVYYSNGTRSVDVLYLVGAIAVHERTETDRPEEYPMYSITHVLSGRLITRETSYSRAVELAQMLSTPGLDWDWRDQTRCPTTTREVARYIAHNRALPLGNCFASQMLRNVNPALFAATEDICTPF